MGRVTVSKEVTFDCAHMLTGHEALCKNLHGHTYRVFIKIYGDQIEGGPSSDMVIDFKDLKAAIEECIKSRFDHAVIFSSGVFRKEAENELLEWAEKFHMRHYIMPRRTTAEDMAIHFAELIKEHLNEQNIFPTEIHVRVYETPTSYAEV